MGPISPVNLGSAGPSANVASIQTRSTGVARPNEPAAGLRNGLSPVSSNSLAIMKVHSAVSSMLQSIGGGLEDDKTLQMLIALIILLSLLENSQANASSTGSALRGLSGGGNNNQPQFLSLSSSSTTIAIQHTSTTIAVASVESLSAFSGTEQLQTRGGQIDLSA